jgi:hypothetical protein
MVLQFELRALCLVGKYHITYFLDRGIGSYIFAQGWPQTVIMGTHQHTWLVG